MKRLLLLVAMFATALSLSAQRSMQVWEGNTYSEFPTGTVDSVTFLLYPEGVLRECKPDTVFVTKTDTVEKIVTKHDTVTVIKKDTVYINTCKEDTKVIGKFSVSADKQVAFAQGNLQYTQSTRTWSFAEHQYDAIGYNNVIGSALGDTIDLFGWSASNTTAPYGISLSQDNADYAGDFVDWGINAIGNDAPNTWRTLTYDEWYYLRYTRTNADNLVGVARLNLNAGGSEYVNGLIFLPDTWVCPAGITFKSGFAENYGAEEFANYQTIALSDWQKMEEAGAVFLPCASYRGGSSVGGVGSFGYYWSATPNDSDDAGILYFGSAGASAGLNWYRYYGRSVRLVQDLKKP